jgi:hypothetical protein
VQYLVNHVSFHNQMQGTSVKQERLKRQYKNN